MDDSFIDPSAYCHLIESYLCRKNDGHLIRIVGPAFEQVCGWARRGIPMKIACRGIDRYFERYYAKGPRRRPVRIEFCEADVLDVFDEWRRAIGVPAAVVSESTEEDGARKGPSLPAHLERAIAKLTIIRAEGDREMSDVVEATVRELDGLRARAKGVRGDARQQIVERLRALDTALIESARDRCGVPVLRQLEGEADAELAPFRPRMTREVYDQARRAATDKLLRDRLRFPTIAYDG